MIGSQMSRQIETVKERTLGTALQALLNKVEHLESELKIDRDKIEDVCAVPQAQNYLLSQSEAVLDLISSIVDRIDDCAVIVGEIKRKLLS